MRHHWIFDVLTDLHDYAVRNELPGLAGKVSDALDVARREIGSAEDGPDDPPDSSSTGGKMH